jgi:hypothetical protein
LYHYPAAFATSANRQVFSIGGTSFADSGDDATAVAQELLPDQDILF